MNNIFHFAPGCWPEGRIFPGKACPSSSDNRDFPGSDRSRLKTAGPGREERISPRSPWPRRDVHLRLFARARVAHDGKREVRFVLCGLEGRGLHQGDAVGEHAVMVDAVRLEAGQFDRVMSVRARRLFLYGHLGCEAILDRARRRRIGLPDDRYRRRRGELDVRKPGKPRLGRSLREDRRRGREQRGEKKQSTDRGPARLHGFPRPLHAIMISAIVSAMRMMLTAPLTLKNAASMRDRSLGLTIECS